MKRRRLQPQSKRFLWLDQLVAVVATANIVCILFDLSYIPGRDWYFRYAPAIVHQTYDPVKGIEPYRDTEQYLDRIDALIAEVQESGTSVLLDATAVEPLLAELRDRSDALIDENPFQLADKIGALERIKRDIRLHTDIESAKDAFSAFWALENLTPQRWAQEIEFFERNLRPYLEINYFRSFSVRGSFTDRFWYIDAVFILFFGLEFGLRTVTTARRLGIPWRKTWLLRGSDLLWLIPFSGLGLPVLALSRLLPWMVRVEQSQLFDLKPLRHHISQGLVAGFAAEITEVVIIRLIDQVQNAIATTTVAELTEARPYINFNDTNEVEALIELFIRLSFTKVLPKIKPDLNALLLHNLTGNISSGSLWQNLRRLPGFQPRQMANMAVDSLTSTMYSAAEGALNDPVGAKLFDTLAKHFSKALVEAVQEPGQTERIKSLLIDLLEEIKINYVVQLEVDDLESILEETQYLHSQAEKRNAQVLR